MVAAQVRSGLVETYHDGAVAVVERDGGLVASSGDIDRPFFIRSAAKPFQATVSQEVGADLSPLEMAMACASHRGLPVHIALVDSMLERAGLDHSALQCPPSWPLGLRARESVIRAGASSGKRVWHNCSGKHAGFLRASIAAGWSPGTYLSSDHPLQRRVVEFVSDLGEYQVGPVGVDGCGAPVLRTTARAMALMYSRLATDNRLAMAFEAMHRYPALVAANGEDDTSIATATHSVAKGGAAGCLGVAMKGGLGVAVKSWDGSGSIAALVAVSALEQLGGLTTTAAKTLDGVSRPAVLGGGRPVGSFRSRLELEFE